MKKVNGKFVLSPADMKKIYKDVHQLASNANFGCCVIGYFNCLNGRILIDLDDVSKFDDMINLGYSPIYAEKSIFRIDYPKSYWYVDSKSSFPKVS